MAQSMQQASPIGRITGVVGAGQAGINCYVDWCVAHARLNFSDFAIITP